MLFLPCVVPLRRKMVRTKTIIKVSVSFPCMLLIKFFFNVAFCVLMAFML